jgi:hypothetical protein
MAAFRDFIGARSLSAPKMVALEGEFSLAEGYAQEFKTPPGGTGRQKWRWRRYAVKAPDGGAVGWARGRASPAGSAEYDSRVAAGLADAPIGLESVAGETGLNDAPPFSVLRTLRI